MDSGRLIHFVTPKRKIVTGRDNKGGEIVTYVALKGVSALVEPLGSRQFEALQVAEANVECRITIYYRDDVLPDWRFEWRGADYEIVGVPRDVGGRKEWLELFCRTSQNG